MTTSRTTKSGTTIGRRGFLAMLVAVSGVLVGARSGRARADTLPPLGEADATASALGYKEDTTKVDATKFPQHKVEQVCSGCSFYQGGTPRGPCQLFPGKSVAAKGWCSAYAKKV
jgi:hypothetical protein